MRYRTQKLVVSLTILALLFGLATVVAAQQYEPRVGQQGKDVIWVPTPEEVVTAMLDTAKVTPDDYVIDLGSGDGRTVIAAARRGARALGVEYNPDMVELSKRNAEKAEVSSKANFVHADIFETDFSQATVLTMYLLPGLNMKLRPKILELKPGTRVVSHAFDMEDWEADRTEDVDERTVYFWIVPAKVAGTWTWNSESGNSELTLSQTFQKIAGNLKIGGVPLPLADAKLEGDRISFAVNQGGSVRWEYSARVKGDTIEGKCKASGGSETAWTAERRAAP
jgi:precorrin-6B methylase 2